MFTHTHTHTHTQTHIIFIHTHVHKHCIFIRIYRTGNRRIPITKCESLLE